MNQSRRTTYLNNTIKHRGVQPEFEGINWAILGGESGPGARPLEQVWVTDIRDQCLMAGVPFFFKQWGGTNKKKGGRVLEGRTWDVMPRGMQVARA